MGRRAHLEVTLPENLSVLEPHGDRVELVLVDYGSRDGLGAWVRERFAGPLANGLLRYARTDEPTSFHMAHAKNVAHRLGTKDVLFNLDADNFVGRDTCERVDALFTERPATLAKAPSKPDVGGRVALRRTDYLALGGYNERLKGWGIEDMDLARRAMLMGLEFVTLDTGSALAHDDATRMENTDPVEAQLTRAEFQQATPRGQSMFKHLRGRDPRMLASYVHNRRIVKASLESGRVRAQEPGAFGQAVLVDHLGQPVSAPAEP